jgi:hypothetical protein
MLEANLNGVQSLALKYLARSGNKEGVTPAQDWGKAIACLEKLLEVGSPLATGLLVDTYELGGPFPKRIAKWALPIPILLILRWLLAAWAKGSTDRHEEAIAKLEELIAGEEAK